MKAFKLFLLVLVCGTGMNVFSQSGYYPPPSSVDFHSDTLTIYPPDSLPGPPLVLLAYNLYIDSVFYDNIAVVDPELPVDVVFEPETILPGQHIFCADAVYNEWISDDCCDSATILYGYELPFLEDWSSGGFEDNLWISTSENWIIEDDHGNPAPTAEFMGDPAQTDYEFILESYPLNALGMTVGRIWLDFDLRLDATVFSGNEWLKVQVWNWTNQVWYTVAEYRNDDENLPWNWIHINIHSIAKNQVFKVRFLATGLNSSEINNWSIDNIHIYRKCDGAVNLQLDESLDYNELQWEGPDGCGIDEWIHWDDGVNAGNSIGTGGAVEFDVAARWTPVLLAEYNGASIHEIAFFPFESAATYYVRVWAGAGPDTLILDQLVNSPVIGQWNHIDLTTPIPLDVTKDLWVGYHVNTPTGYPAGVDDGPPVDGYGNMMYWDSTWQTLLEINPDLDFNWNIACHLIEINPSGTELYYKLYRETNNEGFQFYSIIDDAMEYLDSNIILSDYYCYEMTTIWNKNGDTCESAPTNIACEELMLETNEQEPLNHIRIYPNPANNLLNIESEEAIREVRLYNPLGEMVLKVEIGNSEGQVDVSRFPGGIYYVMVKTESISFTSKIVILR